LTLGPSSFAGGTNTYYIGYLEVAQTSINASSTLVALPTPQGSGPGALVNFDSGALSNGTSFTTTNLATVTYGGNGSWNSCTAPTPVYESTSQLNTTTPIDVSGTLYPVSPANPLGEFIKFSNSASAGQCFYIPNSFSPVESRGEWVSSNASVTDTLTEYSVDVISASNASDYNSHNNHLDGTYIEMTGETQGREHSQSPPATLPTMDISTCVGCQGDLYYPASPSTAYFVAQKFQKMANWTSASQVGGDFIVTGLVTSGSPVLGETVTQASTGATATLINQLPTAIGGSPPAQAMEILAVSGAPDSTHSWTGGTSGFVFQPDYYLSVTATLGTEIADVGYTITQAGSGATALILGGINRYGGGGIRVQELTGAISTGCTSTCAFTDSLGTTYTFQSSAAVPTAYPPGTFMTLAIYNSSCHLVAIQKKNSGSTGTTAPEFGVGRGGDNNGSPGTTGWSSDNHTFNFSTGAMPSCQ
jgi:hypothetical protein